MSGEAPEVKLRAFARADLDALYAISLATGDSGGDASHLYRDGRLIGHIYSAPYALLEPGLAFVAQDEDGVAGYIVGTLDTARFEDRLERDWWPRLRQLYPMPSSEPAGWDADQRRCAMIHRPRRAPPAVAAAFPAHLHMNLMPRLQGRRVGSALLELWLGRARSLGARAAHVMVNAGNLSGRRFWLARGFAPLDAAAGGPPAIWLGRQIAAADATA